MWVYVDHSGSKTREKRTWKFTLPSIIKDFQSTKNNNNFYKMAKHKGLLTIFRRFIA